MKNKKTKDIERIEDIEHEKGSGNVFADLGFEDPEEELLKSDLTGEIALIIKKRKLTQTQVAKILCVDQPRISSLLRGRFDLFSIEMLMHFLQALGQDVEIVVKPKPRNRKLAHLSFVSSNPGRGHVPMVAGSYSNTHIVASGKILRTYSCRLLGLFLFDVGNFWHRVHYQ